MQQNIVRIIPIEITPTITPIITPIIWKLLLLLLLVMLLELELLLLLLVGGVEWTLDNERTVKFPTADERVAAKEPLLIAEAMAAEVADKEGSEPLLTVELAGGEITVVTIIDPVKTPTILTREVSVIWRRAQRLSMKEDIILFV